MPTAGSIPVSSSRCGSGMCHFCFNVLLKSKIYLGFCTFGFVLRKLRSTINICQQHTELPSCSATQPLNVKMGATRSLFSGLVAIAIVVQSVAFSPGPRPAFLVCPSHSILRTSPWFMSPEPTGEIDTTVPSLDEQTQVDDQTESQKKISLLLVPLLFKFCVVLVVKFITDVLVFPPLFFWRFIRLIYRNTVKVVRQRSKDEQVTS